MHNWNANQTVRQMFSLSNIAIVCVLLERLNVLTPAIDSTFNIEFLDIYIYLTNACFYYS